MFINLRKFNWLRPVAIIASLFVVAGIAYAYFTSQAVSANLVFQTGSLKVELTDPSQLEFSNLKPGDEQIVEFATKKYWFNASLFKR